MHSLAHRTLVWTCLLAGVLSQGAGNTVFGDMIIETARSATSPSSPGAQNSNTSSPIAVEFLVNGKPLRGQGAGQCKHEPNASIYSAPASLWTVDFGDTKAGDLKHVTLTVWQPKNESPSQMSLALDTRAGSHRIATVKGGQLVGVGTVNFRSEKSGGRFDIKGKDAAGATIEGSITCPIFGNIIAEGG